MKAMAPWEAARGSRVEKWKALAGLAKKSPKSVQFGGYHIFHLFFSSGYSVTFPFPENEQEFR